MITPKQLKAIDITYFTILYHLAYFLEIGKITSVVSDETRDTSFL